MYRVYEIFEVLPNGLLHRAAVVSGLEFAKVALESLAKRTTDECFAAETKTRQVVMQLNVPAAKLRAARRIFQIAYDEEGALQRAEMLKSRGYWVVVVIGNRAAKVLLSSIQPYDLFIVGDGAPEETKREIVDWLKSNYPKVDVLALNPPGQEVLGADYNVEYQNGPENWLSTVSRALANPNSRELNKASTPGV